MFIYQRKAVLNQYCLTLGNVWFLSRKVRNIQVNIARIATGMQEDTRCVCRSSHQSQTTKTDDLIRPLSTDHRKWRSRREGDDSVVLASKLQGCGNIWNKCTICWAEGGLQLLCRSQFLLQVKRRQPVSHLPCPTFWDPLLGCRPLIGGHRTPHLVWQNVLPLCRSLADRTAFFGSATSGSKHSVPGRRGSAPPLRNQAACDAFKSLAGRELLFSC